MIVERIIKAEGIFCSACQKKLRINKEVGVYSREGKILLFCTECSLQLEDLVDLLAMGGGILKDE